MDKFFYRLKLNIMRIFGREETVIISHMIISFIFYSILVKSTIGFDFERVNYIYSSDIATISGILFGFIGTALGVVVSSKNYILDKLKTTGNIRVLYKTLLFVLLGFIVCLIIYFIKPFFILPNSNTVVNIDTNLLIILLHIGLFCFINSLVLFVLNIYYLKKIFLPKLKR